MINSLIAVGEKKRVYLIFDYINLPEASVSRVSDETDRHECSTSYISIASINKPTESYKLCKLEIILAVKCFK